MVGRPGWSEPAATNAPVEDEDVEAVFRMNQKHISLLEIIGYFSLFSAPKNFPTSPYLPSTYLPLLPPT
jgi:hypothetical protein